METVTIPRSEYLELIDLYRKITKKMEIIEKFKRVKSTTKKINALKFCNTISLSEDALLIQKQMRDEWE